MTLGHWQERLHKHFHSLRDSRKQNPIFALEHNLTNSDLSDLTDAIHAHIAKSSPSDRHWLAWVVYATEIGYKYSGDEYWQTFARSTPGWLQYEDRDFIRDSFLHFQRDFDGARPSGRWAHAFSIICWPITHAILPQDLQRQLAEILYDIRDLYTSDLLQSPALLGEQIDAFSWNSSSRFQHLADDHLLVGQIATALLRRIDDNDSGVILSSALSRIAADLDRERRARDWLSSAMSRAATVRLSGLQRGTQSDDEYVEDQLDNDSEEHRALTDLGLEPRLLLLPRSSTVWEVRLRLPNLSALLGRFPGFKNILANQRCVVTGAKGAPLARGFLLSGSHDVLINSWPLPSDVLLKFENSNPELDYLLRTECLLRPGPRWLLKLMSDGSAMEIRTKTVLPGSSYILMTTATEDLSFAGVQSALVNVSCEGINAFKIDVPDVFSEEFVSQLEGLGIRASSGLSVSPVGLPTARWDDEGYAEWFTSDSPILAISSQHSLKGIALNLVGPSGSRIEISQSQLTFPLFVEIGKLEPGRYKLYVISETEAEHLPSVSGTLSIAVRSRKAAVEVPRSAPFQVFVSPVNPQMEQLWDGTATIQVLGPRGHKADAKVHFFRDSKGDELISSRVLSSIELPCENSSWQERFDAIREDVRTQDAYSEAVLCRLHIQCDDLGQFDLYCEREFVPFRWILRHENNGYWLYLSLLEKQNSVLLTHYLFDRPGQPLHVPFANAEGFRVPKEGGLYVAVADRYSCSILIPPQINALADLGMNVRREFRQRNEHDLLESLQAIEPWVKARTPGDPISRLRKEAIIATLREDLLLLLCGKDWVRIEQNLKQSPTFLTDLKFAVSGKAHHSAFVRALYDLRTELVISSNAEICQTLTRVSIDYLGLPIFFFSEDPQSDQSHWITEFAFALANEPEVARTWAGSHFGDGFRYLIQNPILLRAARFAFLLRANSPKPTEEKGRH